MAVAGLLIAARAHAGTTGMLPNGAALTFERLYIAEDGGAFQQASTPDALRLYLNQAHCACAQAGAGMETDIKWELKLSASTGSHRPASMWVGTQCDDNVQRPMQCKQVNTISDIDSLATRPDFFQWNLADLINGKDSTKNCSGITQANGWVLVDTDGDGTPDYTNSTAVGSGTVTTIDVTPPPALENITAASAEGAVKVSWKLPTSNQNDLFYYQALCVGPDGMPVKSDPVKPRYQTVRTLCDLATDPTLAPTDIEGGDGAVTMPPTALAQLDPAYLCGESTEATGTSLLIDGLTNGTPYKIVLLAIDNYGNTTGTFFTSTVTPQAVTDFWEDLHDRGSDVEGGFCLLAETYGDDSPLTNLLREFRDDTLGGSGAGRALTRAYYASLAKLGVLVHGSLALRIVAGVLLLPLVAIALAWHFLTLPGLLAAIALAWWLRRRKRRLGRVLRLAPAALAGLVLLAPARSHAAPSPYWDADTNAEEASEVDESDHVTWLASIRVGPYTPGIDKQLGMSPGPYKDMFGGARYMPMLDVDRILWRGVGQLGVGLSVGYMQKTAHAWVDGSIPGDPNRMRSPGDENTFRLIPTALSAVYRFTYLDDEYGIPVVPYARVGLAYYIWWVRQNGKTASACWDGTHTQGCDADKAAGASLGVVGSIGLAIRAERIDASAASSMKQSGIEHAGFFGELSMGKVDGFGSSSKLSVGDTTWFAGVDFEF